VSVSIFTGSRDLKLSQAEPWFQALLRDEFAPGVEPSIRACFVGCCPSGLDKIARYFLDPFEPFVIRAHWYPHGPDGRIDRSAGPKRNSRMVTAAAALAKALDVELVCHAWPVGKSLGTRDCMRRAKAAGARVVVHTEEML